MEDPKLQKDWDRLFKKVKHLHKINRKQEKVNLINHLYQKYGTDCINDLNDNKESLGLIKPHNIEYYFEERKNYNPGIQTTLDSDTAYMTSKNYRIIPKIKYRCNKCSAKKPHNQQILEWGAYEWIRKNPNQAEQIWRNYHLNDPDYEHYFLVGNMARYLKSFMVISILRYKKINKT